MKWEYFGPQNALLGVECQPDRLAVEFDCGLRIDSKRDEAVLVPVPFGPYQPARLLIAKYCGDSGRKPRSM